MKRPILRTIVFCATLAVTTVSYAIHETQPSESSPVEDIGTTPLMS